VRAVPGGISDVRVVSYTSRTAVVSWSAINCSQQNGPSVGYACELVRRNSHIAESSSDRATHEDETTVPCRVVNHTRLELSTLVPFTNYTFTVWFRNSDFHGSKTSINFATDEDGV